MGAVIIGIGIAIAVIGAVLAVNGLAIYQSTFGNALVMLGGVGFVGGLTLIALGFIHRALMKIVDRLDGVVHFEPDEDEVAEPAVAVASAAAMSAPAPRPVERAEPVAPAPAPVVSPAAVLAPAPAAPEPILGLRETLARAPVAPPPVPEVLRAPAPEPVVTTSVVAPEPRFAPEPEPDGGATGLPSWFRRTRPSVTPVEPPEIEPQPVLAPEPAPSAADHRYDEPELTAPSWLQSRAPRRESVFHDPVAFEEPRSAPFFPREEESEPEVTAPIIPRREAEEPVPVVTAAPADPDAGPGAPPAFLRHDEPDDDEDGSASDQPAEPAPSVEVLKSGTIGGMAYTLYTDGSIEAELPDGAIRFASLQQLREHVASNAPKPDDEDA